MSTIKRKADNDAVVLKAGSTMSGLLVLSGDPAVALGAATKQYVDATADIPTLGSVWMNTLYSDAPSITGWIACSSSGQYVATVASGDYIYISADYGKTWTQRDSSRAWFNVCMSSTGEKMAACVSGGYIYTSSDYGATWTQRDSTRDWRRIACSEDGTKLVAAELTGSLYYSNDSGATWSSAGTSAAYTSVAMSGDGTYAIATDGTPGYLYTSSDSGATWTQRDSSRAWAACAIDLDGNVMIAATSTGAIYRSTDYGVNWSLVDNSLVSCVSVDVSSDGVFAVASGNAGLKSSDGGASWVAFGLARGGSRLCISDAFDYAFTRDIDDAAFSSVEMPSANFVASSVGSGTDYTLTGSYANVDFGTNHARAYISTAGFYLVYACVQIVADASGAGDVIYAKLNSAGTVGDFGTVATIRCTANSSNERIVLVAVKYLTAGEIRIKAYNATSARGTVTSTGTTIGIVKIA